jgi:DNA-binding NarL/FixJ family response regulator
MMTSPTQRGASLLAHKAWSNGPQRDAAQPLENPVRCHEVKSTALRCLIVDDKDHFLQAASAILERDGITISGLASTSTEALWHVGELRPDVALIDIALGQESGFELVRRLAEAFTEHPTMILISTYDEEDVADMVAASPAHAFVPKTALSGAVIREIHRRRRLRNNPRVP